MSLVLFAGTPLAGSPSKLFGFGQEIELSACQDPRTHNFPGLFRTVGAQGRRVWQGLKAEVTVLGSCPVFQAHFQTRSSLPVLCTHPRGGGV